MFGRGSLLQIPFVIAGLLLGGFVVRYAYTQGFHTIVAAERANKPPAVQPLSLEPLSGCGLDPHLQYQNPLRCQMEMRAAGAGNRQPLVFHAAPLPTMTKAQSEQASGWFLLAGLGIPLSLGIAGFFGYVLFRHATARVPEDRH